MNEDFLELQEQLYNSTGWITMNRIDKLKISMSTFAGNYSELEKYLLILDSPTIKHEIWKKKNQEKLDGYHKDLIRLLHNFTTSSKSLIDHIRVFMTKDYEDTNLYSEYKIRIRLSFDQNSMIKFVQDLRNYIVHQGIPPTNIMLRIQGESTSSMLILDIDELLKYKNWKYLSKKYLNCQDDDIEILNLIREYFIVSDEFNRWLLKKLIEFHNDDFESMWIIQDKLNEIYNERFKK